jgi:iron complex outermembrane receptor protein
MTALSPITDSGQPATRLRRGVRPLALGLALAAASSSPARAAVDLTAVSLEQLLEVTVVGASKYEQRQADVAAAVSVITRQEIKAHGWRTIDEALASLPGVYTTYDRQTVHFGARGFGLPGDFNTRVLVTINGNRVNDPTYDSGLFGQSFPVDIDLIERIEFIPGPGGAVYGPNAMFGVVNVITRRGVDLGGTEVAAAWQHPQALHESRASWGRLLDNGVDLLVSVSRLHGHGEDRYYDFGPLPVAGVAVGMAAQKGHRFLARVARGPWELEHLQAWNQSEDPTASYLSTPLVPGQSAATRSALTQIRYQDSFAGDTLQLSARLFSSTAGTLETLSYGGGYYETSLRSRWNGGELRMLSTVLTQHKLMLGLESQDIPVSEQALHGRGFVDPSHDFVIRSPGYRVGLYAQDEWRFAELATATLGLRVDRTNVTATEASPRAALIWQATPATTFKALYGRARRAPNAFERDYDNGHAQIANPSLAGETIDTLECVADHRVGQDLALRASVYQWNMLDIITQRIEPVSGIPQYQSGEKVRARGLELSADKTWSSGARLRGSVSLQDVRYVSGGELPNAPKVLGKLDLTAPLPLAGLHAGYELRYDSSRSSLDGSRLGGYAVSNLTVSADTLAPGLELSLTASNLFDKRYAQPAAATNWQNALVQDGRSLRVALALAF